MKKIFFIVLFFISAGNCFGQQVTFQKIYAVSGNILTRSVVQTTDGGYIICGYSQGAAISYIFLIKTDAYGGLEWTKTFDGPSWDQGYCVIQTNDGGYLLSGNIYSNGNGNSLLLKTDANGNILWNKTYDIYTNDRSYSIAQTPDNGFIIGGFTADNLGDEYAHLIKTDSIGNVLWSQIYAAGEAGNVYPTPDGGYMFCIKHYSSSYLWDVCLMKTDSIGNPVWSKVFRGPYQEQGDIWKTADGGYIIAGLTDSYGAGFEDVLLIKTDSIANMLWAKTYGGSGNDDSWGAQQTIDGGYIISGQTNFSNVYLIKTGANGDTTWTRSYGQGWGSSVKQTADSGYIICGGTNSFGSDAVYLIKTDANGNAGCNQGGTATITGTPALQVISIPTFAPSSTIGVSSAVLVTGTGGPDSTLCTSVVGISPTPSPPQAEVVIAPNPATNNFTITFPNTIHKGSIEIYNVFGKKIFSKNISNACQKEIHLKNSAAGIYFVKVSDGEKEYCKKLLIK